MLRKQDSLTTLNGQRSVLEQQLAQSVSDRDRLERERGALELGARDMQQQLAQV